MEDYKQPAVPVISLLFSGARYLTTIQQHLHSDHHRTVVVSLVIAIVFFMKVILTAVVTPGITRKTD